MVQAKQMQDRGMQIVHVRFVFDCMVPEFIRFAEAESGFDATAGQEDRKTVWVVVASGAIVLSVRGAPKFPAPPNERVF